MYSVSSRTRDAHTSLMRHAASRLRWQRISYEYNLQGLKNVYIVIEVIRHSCHRAVPKSAYILYDGCVRISYSYIITYYVVL